MKKFNILSPDQFPISMENFDTPELADQYFSKWIKKFEMQGYYSSNKGRIELANLRDFCTSIEVEEN